MSALLSRLAKALSRAPNETDLVGDQASVRGKLVMLAALVIPVFVVFAPLAAIELSGWNTGRPALPLESKAWHVFYGPSPESCDELVAQTTGCLANPANSTLFKSPFTRADSEHSHKIDGLQQGEFWLGAELGADALFRARKAGANQFILGSISGGYRVWLDGDLIVEGTYANTRLPLVLAVPMTRLESNRPLRISVQIFHDAFAARPDRLGGERGEGFATVEQARYYTYKTLFWDEARPWFLFGADALIAAFFLLLWSSARRKQEYFYVGLYAAAHALLELGSLGMITRGLGVAGSTRLDLVLSAYEGVFGLLLGLSFSRARRSFFTWGLPLGLGAPWIAAFVIVTPAGRAVAAGALDSLGAPLLLELGAAACIVQAVYLRSQNRLHKSVRASRLAWFAFVVTTLVVLKAVAPHATSTIPLLLDRFSQFCLVLVLCAIVMRDYRESDPASVIFAASIPDGGSKSSKRTA